MWARGLHFDHQNPYIKAGQGGVCVLQRQRQANSWSFMVSQSHAPGKLWGQRETLPQITGWQKRNNTQGCPVLSTCLGTCAHMCRHMHTHMALPILPSRQVELYQACSPRVHCSDCIPRHSFVHNGPYQPAGNRPEVLVGSREE